MIMRRIAWLAAVTLLACAGRAAEPTEQVVDHGEFHGLHLVSLANPRGPTVLLASDAAGWDARARDLARDLARAGALVVGVDTPAFLAKIDAGSPPCVTIAGPYQNLAHFAQAYMRLPSYQPALLVGLGAGASLSVAAQLQAAEHSFAGTIARGFCGELALSAPFCPGAGLQPSDAAAARRFVPARAPVDPLYLLASHSEPACANPLSSAFQSHMQPESTELRTLYASLARSAEKRAVRAPQALGDLPVVEVPARPGSPNPDAFAIMLSGDGGWAEIDQALSAGLAQRGVDVAGLDSLRYFWGEKSPEATARDVARLIDYYAGRWQRSRAILIGFSQGADVLPFIWNRLPQSERARVVATVALSIGKQASFEFHVTNWVSSSNEGLPILPEMQKLAGNNVWCVYGAKDDESLCPELAAQDFERVRLPGGHHYDGQYDAVARLVMDALAKGEPPR